MPALAGIEAEAFVFLAVFCRVGGAVMLFPGIGELTVPPRIRLMFALAVTVLVLPLVREAYPPRPEELLSFLTFILTEIAVGLAFGLLLRTFLMALQVAGTIIATQGGLAFAQSFDPSLGIQGAIVSSFLTILALTLIFAADLHHLMLGGMMQTFAVVAPGEAIPWDDLADRAARVFADVFTIGLQLSAPILVFGLVFYAAAGMISKLLPQVQIFFLAMPLNIIAAFGLLMLTIGSMMVFFLERFSALLAQPFG